MTSTGCETLCLPCLVNWSSLLARQVNSARIFNSNELITNSMRLNMIKKMTSLVLVCRSLIVFLYLTVATNVLADSTLEGAIWQWTCLKENEPASQTVVPKPENYTVTFNQGGGLQIKADCNMVQGGYTLEGDRISILLGPSTLAACGEQSLDRQFLGLLERVNSYTIKDDQLILYLLDEKGIITFKR